MLLKRVSLPGDTFPSTAGWVLGVVSYVYRTNPSGVSRGPLSPYTPTPSLRPTGTPHYIHQVSRPSGGRLLGAPPEYLFGSDIGF